MEWQQGNDSFKPKLVGVVKGGEVFAVYVENCNDAIARMYRNYYFRARSTAACYVSGEFLYIGDYDGMSALPCSATDAPSLGNTGACHRALEGTEHQFVTCDTIKSYPPEVEGLVEAGRDVCHIGYDIIFVLNECLYLWKEVFVEFLLVVSDDR